MVSVLLLIAGSQLSYASGYHLGLQSVSAITTATANDAEAGDASTIATNPAGLSKLEGTQINNNVFLIQPEINYKHASGQYLDGSPVQGRKQGGITPQWQAIPQWYGSHQLNDKWTVGLGIYVPYAAKTNDHTDSVLRYNVNATNVKSVDISPTVAFKINEHHAVGVGAIAQYMHTQLQKYADFTPVGTAITGIPSSVLHEQAPGAFDVDARVKGHDWGYGFNAGWLWDINKDVRLGVSYRSKINHKLKGTARWIPKGSQAIANAPALNDLGYTEIEGASVPLTTPEVWSIHGMWQVDPQWQLFGHVNWTHADRLKDLDISFEHDKLINISTGQTSNNTHMVTNWRNTYNIALGAAYQQNDKLQWRAGISYDQSPVRNSNTRLPTLPDGNRWLFGTGFKYDIDKQNTISASYAYLHIQKTHMHQQDSGEHVSSNVLGQANYRANAHILGLSYNHRF